MMQSTEKFDLTEAERQILERIDIAAEAARLGFRFSSPSANDSGWREGQAVGREDSNPSAAICVASNNVALGRYRDLGGDGTSCSFWEFAVLTGRFPDWREARAHFAKIAGVSLPGSGGQREMTTKKKAANSARRKLLKQITKVGQDEKLFEQFAAAKNGVTVAALRAAEARTCLWKKITCIAFLAFNGDGRECAILLYRADGEEFPAVGKLSSRKTHLIGGSRDGWIIIGGRATLAAADVILCVEGMCDTLTMHPRLPVGAIAMTNVCGASARSRLPVGLLKDKRVFVIGDLDEPGQRGAEAFARTAAAVAAEVRLIRLPGEITKKHGADLRDFWNEGGTSEQFQRLVTDSELVPKPTADESAGRTNGQPVEADDDPHRLAGIAMEQMTFRFWQSDFYRWNGRSYELLERDEVRAMLTGIVKREFDRINSHQMEDWQPTDQQPEPPTPQKVGKALVSNVTQALESLTITPFKSDWPRWTDDRSGEFIAVANGILNTMEAIR